MLRKLATAAYLELYRTDPNSFRLTSIHGRSRDRRSGDDAKAIKEYHAAVAARPDVPNLHYGLGHLLWKDLQVPEARRELQTELAINPQHAGALHDLGNTYLAEHRPEKQNPIWKRPSRPTRQTRKSILTWARCMRSFKNRRRPKANINSPCPATTMDQFITNWRDSISPSIVKKRRRMSLQFHRR